jgi:hypothetical protein
MFMTNDPNTATVPNVLSVAPGATILVATRGEAV